MLVDYHTHHARCGHATGTMVEYIEAALAGGLEEIGLSDHSPIYDRDDDPHPLPQTAMSQHELPAYIAEMAALRDRYAGRITVRLGVESDYLAGWDEHYRRLWRATRSTTRSGRSTGSGGGRSSPTRCRRGGRPRRSTRSTCT